MAPPFGGARRRGIPAGIFAVQSARRPSPEHADRRRAMRGGGSAHTLRQAQGKPFDKLRASFDKLRASPATSSGQVRQAQRTFAKIYGVGRGGEIWYPIGMDKSSLAYALIRVEGARDVSMGVPCGIDVGVGNYSGAIVPGGASGRTRVQSITDDGGAGLMHLDATAFSSGWVVRDTRVMRWRQRGYYRANGCLYVLGPYHAGGKSLVEVMRGGAGAVHYLSRLARALARLERLRVNIGVLHLRGVVFLDDGGVLFVSQDTVQLMCLYQGAGDAFNFSLPFNNQQLSGEGRLSFALAVLSYMALSGSLPWDAPSVKDLRNYMLSGVVPHIHYHNPAVKASIAQELNLILSKPTRSMPLLDYWVSSYAEWLQGGTHDTITERQGQENVRCAHVGYDERKRSFTRLRRLRENWLRGFVTVVLVGSVLLVSLFITGNRGYA